jgi:hypothetical protein
MVFIRDWEGDEGVSPHAGFRPFDASMFEEHVLILGREEVGCGGCCFV